MPEDLRFAQHRRRALQAAREQQGCHLAMAPLQQRGAQRALELRAVDQRAQLNGGTFPLQQPALEAKAKVCAVEPKVVGLESPVQRQHER
jgi:hypothetical protein